MLRPRLWEQRHGHYAVMIEGQSGATARFRRCSGCGSGQYADKFTNHKLSDRTARPPCWFGHTSEYQILLAMSTYWAQTQVECLLWGSIEGEPVQRECKESNTSTRIAGDASSSTSFGQESRESRHHGSVKAVGANESRGSGPQRPIGSKANRTAGLRRDREQISTPVSQGARGKFGEERWGIDEAVPTRRETCKPYVGACMKHGLE